MSKMTNKKGQAAMEFLMTYGWALLVVLIVIAALAFFGLLNPNRFLPAKCEITPGLTCMDYNALSDGEQCTAGSTTDNITILLNNGMGQNLDNLQINITECLDTSGNVVSVGSDLYDIPQGRTEAINISPCCMTPNSKFRSDLVVNYDVTVDSNTLHHVKRGYIVVEVEEP